LAEANQDVKMKYQGTAAANARAAIANSAILIDLARQELIRFLGTKA